MTLHYLMSKANLRRRIALPSTSVAKEAENFSRHLGLAFSFGLQVAKSGMTVIQNFLGITVFDATGNLQVTITVPSAVGIVSPI